MILKELCARSVGRRIGFLLAEEEMADPLLSYFNLESQESRRAKDILKRIDNSEVRVFFRERMAEAIAEKFVVFFPGAAIMAIVKGIGKLSGKGGAEEEILLP